MDVGELDVLVTPAVNQLVTLYPLVSARPPPSCCHQLGSMASTCGQHRFCGPPVLLWCQLPSPDLRCKACVPQVQGGFNIQRLVGQLKPKLVIPLENANFPSTGPLTKLIWQQETNESLPARLEAAGIKGVRVEQCRPVGEAIDIRL